MFIGPEDVRDLAHEGAGVVADEHRRRLGDCADHRLEPLPLFGGEVLQHIGLDELLHAGMADTDPHAPVIGAERVVDRAQPVMAAGAAAALHPELAFGKIDVVMDDGNFAHIDFVEARRRADAVAARIHIGLGLEQQHARVADDTFRESALELWPKGREAIARGDRIRGHEADIVPGHRIA